MNDTSTTGPAPRWLLYGASGYTGRLIAEEALARGHRPVLAGRSREKLLPLGDALGLEVRVLDLGDVAGVRAALEGMPLVVHAAGPFVHTARPVREACLAAGAHYLDLTGELPVIEDTFAEDARARAAGVALVPAVGFDVVPSDCLAAHVAARVGGRVRALELAFATSGRASVGTARSVLEMLPRGGFVRRGGRLVPHAMGRGARRVRFGDGHERLVVPVPWGDLVTAAHSTGAEDVTALMALPPAAARALRVAAPLLQRALAVRVLRERAGRLVDRLVTGPDADARRAGRCQLWARAVGVDGRSAEAFLEVPEAYRLTAVTAVRAVEALRAAAPGALVGARSPAQAFGADFILQVDGVVRRDG